MSRIQPSPAAFLASNCDTLHPSAQQRGDRHRNGAATFRTIQRACLGDQHNCHNHLSRCPGGRWIRGPVLRTHLHVQYLQACVLNPESSRPLQEERRHSAKCRGILHFFAMQNTLISCHGQQVADCRHPDKMRTLNRSPGDGKGIRAVTSCVLQYPKHCQQKADYAGVRLLSFVWLSICLPCVNHLGPARPVGPARGACDTSASASDGRDAFQWSSR